MIQQPKAPHEAFEILLEKRIQVAEMPEESVELDKHLATCLPCRQDLEMAQAQQAMLNRETAALVEGFDWSSAEQAIRNRVEREKSIGSAPRVVGLLVSLAIFWPILTMAGWLAFSPVALALVATFGYWEWSSRTRPKRLLAQAMRGGEDLIEAYAQHDRDARKERGAERFVAIVWGALLVGIAVNMALSGNWLGALVAVLLVDLMWTLVRPAFARVGRERNDLLNRGLISWSEYLSGPLPRVDGEAGLDSKAATRALWISRVRLLLCLAVVALLIVEAGGSWYLAAGALLLLHAIRIVLRSRFQRLLKQDEDGDANA